MDRAVKTQKCVFTAFFMLVYKAVFTSGISEEKRDEHNIVDKYLLIRI